MNSEEPQKKLHFYGGCNTLGYYFIQNGNPEKIFSFGLGYNGELANGKSYSTKNYYPTPEVCTQIPKTGKVKQIAKGQGHALFLMSPKKNVYGVGKSEYGTLSTSQKEVLTPILLYSSAIENVKMSSVSCGNDFSVLLSENGVPYSCGENSNGQCGVGKSGRNSKIYSAIPMKFDEKVIQIDCGGFCAVLLTNKRDIYKTGYINNEGTVSIPTKLNLNEKVKYFRVGYRHLLVVGRSEQLYGIGYNEYNQLTSNIPKNGVKVLTKINSFNGKKIKDIKCGYYDSYVLLENGELYGWGSNYYGQSKGSGSCTTSYPHNPTPFKMKSNVEQVEVGSSSCFAFCEDGVYVCGCNGNGELGMGHKTSISTFTFNKNIVNIKSVRDKYDNRLDLSQFGMGNSSKDVVEDSNRENEIEKFKKRCKKAEYKCEMAEKQFELSKRKALEGKEENVKKLKKLEKKYKKKFKNVLELNKQLEITKNNALAKVKEENKKLMNELERKVLKYKNKYRNAKIRINELENSSDNLKNESETHKDYEIHHSEVLLLKKIGSGGFGKCYLSKWIGSGGDVDVVVKSIKFKGIKVTSKKVFDEIKVQFSIRNPSICRIYGFSLPTPSKVYIIMEKMDYDVNKMIKENKFTLDEKLKIMEKMTQSVQVIHSKNILHRDLKSSNFLADKSGNIKLTDFGIATVMKHSQTHIQSGGKGSLSWMDPTLIDDEDYDIGNDNKDDENDEIKVFSKETDIYSLGCCFFEVLFEKEPYGIMSGKFQKKAKKIKNVPKEIIEKLLSCIQDDKDERPTASELLKWFASYSKTQ